MKQPVPVFVTSREAYVADACVPLEDAANKGKITMHAVAHGSYPGCRLEKNVLQGLSSIGYWDCSFEQEWGLGWHRNEGFEVCFLETGKLQLTIDREDNSYQVKPGHITITHPWQRHRLGEPNIGPSRLHWIIFDVNVRRPNQKWAWPDWIILSDNDLNDLTDFFCYTDQPLWQSTRHLRECFRNIAAILASPEPEKRISLLAVKINELFILLLEQFRMHNPQLKTNLSGSQKSVQVFLQDLETNLNSAAHQWTLEEMASHCGLGKTQFRHYCRELTNMLPVEYLMKCRADWAVKLMQQDGGLSMTKIAIKCGFSSSQYFSTIFRRIKECSPIEYRKNCIPPKP
jgi:AraC-like DNA-binding protein/quercetin dioxygenase-like cupin family protein